MMEGNQWWAARYPGEKETAMNSGAHSLLNPRTVKCQNRSEPEQDKKLLYFYLLFQREDLLFSSIKKITGKD